MRLIHGPVVDAADPFDDGGETAELPSGAVVGSEVLRLAGPERLVPAPGSGLRGWWDRWSGVLRHCGVPLVAVAALTAGPVQLFASKVSDLLFAAPLLSDELAGSSRWLLPAMWLAYLAMAALPVVLCLAVVVAVVVGWAAEGRRPGPGGVARLVGHRAGLLWVWFALSGAVSQLLPLVTDDPRATPRLAVALSAALAVASTALTLVMGLLGGVVLFERGNGPRRVRRLLAALPAPSLIPLVAASAALAVLPSAADAAFGTPVSAAVAVGCAVLWSVTSLITYAQARRAEGPVTSALLAAELAW